MTGEQEMLDIVRNPVLARPRSGRSSVVPARRRAVGLAVLCCIPGFLPPASAAQEKHAVLIGIDSYNAINVPELRYAEADAFALRPILEELGWEVKVLDERRATRRGILGELIRLRRELESPDEMLLFFAGHGVRNTESVGKETYWLTYNAEVHQLEIEGIQLGDLMDLVAQIRAGKKLILLDHCFAGDLIVQEVLDAEGRSVNDDTIAYVVRGAEPLSSTIEPQLTPSKGVAILAGARDEAYELDDIQHGVFTKAVIEALTTSAGDADTDGVLDVGELAAYVKEKVPEYFDALPEVDTTRVRVSRAEINQEVLYQILTTNSEVAEWVLRRSEASSPVIAQLVADFSPALYDSLSATVGGWDAAGKFDTPDYADEETVAAYAMARGVCDAALRAWMTAATGGGALQQHEAEIVRLIRATVRHSQDELFFHQFVLGVADEYFNRPN